MEFSGVLYLEILNLFVSKLKGIFISLLVTTAVILTSFKYFNQYFLCVCHIMDV